MTIVEFKWAVRAQRKNEAKSFARSLKTRELYSYYDFNKHCSVAVFKNMPAMAMSNPNVKVTKVEDGYAVQEVV